jgi:predicted MFS family arabinose efflux permease
MRYLPAIALWSIATGAFTPFVNAYFAGYLQMPIARVGLIFSGAQLLQVVAILLAPVVFRKFGLITGIMYTQVATAVVLAGLAANAWPAMAGLVYAGYVAFQWMSEPGIYSLLMNQVTPPERSGAAALNTLVISVFQALSAAVAGVVVAHFGYPSLLMAAALVACLAAFLFRVLLRNVLDHPEFEPSAGVLPAES